MTSVYNFDLGVADGNPQLAPLADLPALYTKIAALKPKIFRLMVPWNLVCQAQLPGAAVAGAVPPTNLGRNWSYIDRCINDILLLVGCDILLIVGQGHPSWGGFQFLFFNFGATASTSRDYGLFVTEVVNRYKPGGVGIRTDGIYAPNAGKGVTHWEVWNEQNSQLWGGNVNPTDYTAHLKEMYNSVKAIQPGTQSTVLYGGLQHVIRETSPYFGYGSINLDEITFLKRCYDAGARGYFDALATHIYTQTDNEDPPIALPGTTKGPVPATTTDNWQQLLAIRALMVAQSDAKDIWITEVGFGTQTLTEAQQSAYMQQVLMQLSGLSYIKTVIQYNVRDMGTDTSTIENTWGMLHYDMTPKALYTYMLSVVPDPNVLVRPLPATLTLTGSRPALGVTIRPAGYAVTIVGGTPVVTATANKIFTPNPGGLILTPGTPTVGVTHNVLVTPSPAALLIFGGTPVLGSTLTVTPSPATLFATGAIPVVSATQNKTVIPTGLPMTVVGGTPVVTATANKFVVPTPAALVLALSAPVVGVSDNKLIVPGAAALIATRSAPTVSLSDNKLILPAAGSLTVTGGTPTVTVAAAHMPVTFDAVGGGNIANNSFNPNINITWTHTCSGANRAVIVAFSSRCGGQTPSGQTRTVTYDGAAMTLLATITYGSDEFTEIYGLLNPPTGAKTVSVTVGNGSNTGRALAGSSTSWNNVASFGATATNSGTGTTASLSSMASAVNEIVAQAFGVVSASFTSYSQTQRYNGQSGDAFARCLIGDVAGASTVSFSSAISTSAAWGAVAARLLPV